MLILHNFKQLALTTNKSNVANTRTDRNATCAIAAFFVLVVVTGTASVFAYHESNIRDFEQHVWSKSPADGHLSHLACDLQNNYCALKIRTMGGIQTHSQNAINAEVDTVEAHFDSLGKKMSIDRVASANSVIKAYNLDPRVHGYTDYELHCVSYFWWWCINNDSHFISAKVLINDNSDEVNFQLAENRANREYDIRKTLGHELFHAMGIDHNSSSDSIVYYQYVFGTNKGYTATTVDRNDLGNRYP